MGGSSSKTVVNNLSESITNIAQSTVQSCIVNTNQAQSNTITNTGIWGGSVKTTQTTDVSSQCFSDSKKQTDLQNQILNAVKQASTADGVGLLSAFGASKSEAESNLTSIVKGNITMSNIQNNYNSIKQNQDNKISNSGIWFGSVDTTQGAKVFAAATLQAVENAGIFNKITNYVDQKSAATTENPLDFIGKLFGNITSTILYIVLFFFLLIAAIVAFVVFKKRPAA